MVLFAVKSPICLGDAVASVIFWIQAAILAIFNATQTT